MCVCVCVFRPQQYTAELAETIAGYFQSQHSCQNFRFVKIEKKVNKKLLQNVFAFKDKEETNK